MMGKTVKGSIPANIKDIIKEAVEAGRKAERIKDNPFKQTEKRLYAIPTLAQKIEDDCEYLNELNVTQRMPEHSRDLTRFSKGGTRVSPEDKLEELIKSLKVSIAEDSHEIETVRRALTLVENDPFYPAIQAKYFGAADDGEIVDTLHYDLRTIQRHRSRIISQLSVRFYGAQAIC
jgi:hypothetical protein